MAIPRIDAAHLLRRSGFAVTTAGIDDLAGAASWTAAVDRVLTTTGAPMPAMPPEIGDTTRTEWDRWAIFVDWWIELMRTTPCPIVEKMALFFHGHHFGCNWLKNQDVELAWNQIDLFRRNALGDYHQLAQSVAIDPWMLDFLDNGRNRAGVSVNENFGRELLELFTVGRDQYTEADVVAMSLAWTGHNLSEDRRTYVFNPELHDDGPKTLFGITRNWDGPEALSETLLGVKAVAASRHLTRKLWAFLVGTEPAATTIDALAAAFRASGLSLRALVRAIFLRPEFRTAAARTALVRSPIEWFVALTAALDIPASDSKPRQHLTSMGQAPLRPPSAAGWGRNEDWLASSYWWRRGDFLSAFRWVATADAWPYRRFAELNQNSSPTAVSEAMFHAFGIVDPSPQTRAVLEDFVAAHSGGWHGWSTKTSAIVITALSPEFVVGY